MDLHAVRHALRTTCTWSHGAAHLDALNRNHARTTDPPAIETPIAAELGHSCMRDPKTRCRFFLGYRRDFRQARIDCNRHNSSPTLRRITQRKTGNRFALHEAIEHHGLEPVCRHLQRIVEGLALGTIASSRPEGPAEKPAALLSELEFADIHLYLRPASRLIAAAS